MGVRTLTVIIVLGIVATGAGYYINGRQLQSAPLSHITTLSQIENVPPTECSYGIGAYGTGSAGNMYIDNNFLLVSIPDLELTGFNGSMQAVIGIDGTRSMDPASFQAAKTGGRGAATILNTVITQAPWSCSPWWFPNGSLFTIPNGVSF